ncbi:MAG: NUDIX domain-containing protein [Pseudomonadota bacterium]
MFPPATPPFDDVPVFGTFDPARSWRDRHVVYAVVVDDAGRLLVVDHAQQRLLPGGGINAGETAAEALLREGLEEVGQQLEVGREFGLARHFFDPDDGAPPRHKLCRYRQATAGAVVGPPSEPDHVPLWLPVDRALSTLTHAVDRWAVSLHVTGTSQPLGDDG